MRLVVDTITFGAREVPRWNPISISGYHIREAGSTAVQELAFTLRDGIEYVEWVQRAGMPVDEFAPRLSFFFNAHSDLFEEVAKYRAARKIWARVMRERFGATNPRSWLCRFHTQTAGCSLTAQQPYNNVVRTTLQALAAVLGGTQSLHTNSLDEAWALPTEEAVTIALRTQQVLAHESGVTQTVDPLAGSYFIEKLTLETERACYDYFQKIDAMGGMVPALECGYPQKEIHDAAYAYQQAVERKEKIIVGVNDYVTEEDRPIKLLVIDDSVARHQVKKLEEVRQKRDNAVVQRTLEVAGKRRRDRRKLDALHPGMRARLRHRGRNVRRAAQGVWHLRGAGVSMNSGEFMNYESELTWNRHQREVLHGNQDPAND